ncbi:MAG: VIT domain-containing protein, partial [Planctomycetota bacterium]
MKFTNGLIILAALVLLSEAALGQAIVEARIRRTEVLPDTPPPPPVRPNAVYITNHTVNVTITDGAAGTEIDQIFHNPTGNILEGTYIFPLPPEAAVDRFSMFMNGKEVSGEVMEATKARAIYEEIVRRMRDPGLVELIGKKLIRARVFPIPARGDVRVKIQYAQALGQVGDLTEYVYPLNSRRFSKVPLKQVVVGMTIKSKWPIKSVYSPSHTLDLVRKSDTVVRASYEGKGVAPGRDFQLFYNVSSKDFGLGLLCHNTPREDGFFMSMIAPKTRFTADEITMKDIVFVVDTSGSMRGEKIEQARKALVYCLKGLSSGDRFGLIDFSTEARMYSETLLAADADTKEDAVRYAEGLRARGGTNINGALKEALALKDGAASGRIFMIVFLTDGEPTIEVQDPRVILKNVEGWNTAKDRIFVFGVGFDVNTEFLDKLAGDNRGSRDYVKPEENLELRLSAFYDKIAYPVLSDLVLDFHGMKTHDVYPKKLPDLFRGSQILVFGRYAGSGKATAVLRGRIAGKQAIFEFPVEFKAKDRSQEFIPGLWARRKVGHLLDEIRLNGFHGELKNEIVRLGKRYGIVTPYTSFLVTEDTARPRPTPRRDRGRRPMAGDAPGGVPGGGAPHPPAAGGARAPVPTPSPSPSTPGPTAEAPESKSGK